MCTVFLLFETYTHQQCFDELFSILHDIIIRYYCSLFNAAELYISNVICTITRTTESTVYPASFVVYRHAEHVGFDSVVLEYKKAKRQYAC